MSMRTGIQMSLRTSISRKMRLRRSKCETMNQCIINEHYYSNEPVTPSAIQAFLDGKFIYSAIFCVAVGGTSETSSRSTLQKDISLDIRIGKNQEILVDEQESQIDIDGQEDSAIDHVKESKDYRERVEKTRRRKIMIINILPLSPFHSLGIISPPIQLYIYIS